ncbi:MAG: hypothetical protein JO141_19370 [Bradyrhizobium sp.]|nr:hypothetical protein [Bradyrhizobium sp.]
MDKVDRHADACLISCTAIKSAPVIIRLEAALHLPLLTSNQSMVWYLLRSNGIDAPVEGYGGLFSAESCGQSAAKC